MCGVFQKFCSLGKKTLRKSPPLAGSCYWCSIVPRLNGLSAPRKRNQRSTSEFPRCWPNSWARIPRFYKRFCSRHGVHLVCMWPVTELLTHQLLLCSNLPKWNMVRLRSHRCQTHKGCSTQPWNSQSRKHCFAILFVGEGSGSASCNSRCFSMIPYLILQPAWYQRMETYEVSNALTFHHRKGPSAPDEESGWFLSSSLDWRD